jgi:AcrR family transcriptional regulator
MARPKSDEKRSAILAAAIGVIAAQGLTAPTASIARAAGVSNGALFTYFDTKAALLNALYLQLKADMAQATMAGLPLYTDLRVQMRHVWDHWVAWALAHPDERKVLAYLAVSHDITPATRDAAGHTYAGVARLLDQSRAQGVLRDVPLMFAGTLVMALLDATVNYMTLDAAAAPAHAAAGFDALWRMLA